jgi:hypothetical protein
LWARQFAKTKLNWEYVNKNRMAKLSSIRDKFWSDLELDNVEHQFVDFFGTSPALWVPSGIAALRLGVDAARGALGRENPWRLSPA